jgi:multidrug efflux system membrane fusion protein
MVDVGNLVGKNESTLLTTINNTDPLYAYFAPSEEDFQKIAKFRKQDVMQAYINLNYQSEILKNEPIFGHVDFTDNTVNSNTSTVSMRAEVPNTDHTVLPGTFVYVNVFITDAYELIGIPPQVIFEDQRGKYVYTVGQDQTAQRVYISSILDSRFFVLLKKDGGLKDGDKIIINALLRLKPGVKVIPTDMTQTKGLDAVLKANNLIPALPKKES